MIRDSRRSHALEDNGLLNHPLLWSTVAIYAFAGVIYMWSDFVQVFSWLAS